MKQQLLEEYSLLEKDRETLFNTLTKHSDEVLNKKPNPEAWSVIEVLAHVMTAEEMSLKYLSKKVQDTSKAGKERLNSKFKWLLLKFVFTFDIKFRAPDIVTPKIGYTSLADVNTRWISIRKDTRDILGRLSEDELERELWKHAISGKLNLFHMVKFFGIHYNRHKKQVFRTLKAVT